MEKRERFKNIDFLRFVGTILIVFFHIIFLKGNGLCHAFLKDVDFYNTLLKNVIWGGLWVEFFFILSGFFMFLNTDFSMEFKDFFKKKVIRLWPVIMFSILLCMVLSWFDIVHYSRYVNIFNMLLINNVGLNFLNIGENSHSWYVSSLFWTMMFYFYLHQLVNKKWLNLIVALILLFSYSFVLHTNLLGQLTYFNFISIGMLRALAGVSVGYFIAEWYKNLKEEEKYKKCTIIENLLFSIIECYLFIFIVRNTVFHKIHYDNWLIIVLAFIAIILLFLLKRGFLSKLLENNISMVLGRYSYSIYIMHFLVHNILRRNFWDIHRSFVIAHPVFNLILPVILAILLGVVTYHLVERPAARYLKNKWFPDKDKKPEMLDNTATQPVGGGGN